MYLMFVYSTGTVDRSVISLIIHARTRLLATDMHCNLSHLGTHVGSTYPQKRNSLAAVGPSVRPPCLQSNTEVTRLALVWRLPPGLPRGILYCSNAPNTLDILRKYDRVCYKPEGRGFETQWGKLIFSIYLTLPATLGPGIYSASNRNEYQKHKNNSLRE
jgi:hypothetical protein